MSLVQTGEQRNAASQERTEPRRGRGVAVTLITVEAGTPLPSSSVSLCPSVSLSSRASPLHPPLPLRSLLFYFWFEALFNFCREIFPPRNDYCSPEIAEMEEENRSRLAAFLCLRTRRDATHRHVNGHVGGEEEKNHRCLRRKIKRRSLPVLVAYTPSLI